MAKQGHEIPTIDIVLFTVTPASSGIEIGLQTASKLAVNPQTETQDAVKLVVKGALLAQKPAETTITGNTLVLTDNVFIPELVKILQGGTIKYWADADKTAEGAEDKGFGVARYTPPVAGSREKGEVFVSKAYSAIYNAAGVVTGYECISYPNCQGIPVAFSSEDGVFRAPEYTINSAPDKGQAPYEITYLKELPNLEVNV
jgi:hypothetical protein